MLTASCATFPNVFHLSALFLISLFEFTQFLLWVIFSVPSPPNLFSFQLDEALSVRWCFMFLKITPFLASYAADGPNTLHCTILAPMSIDILKILNSKKKHYHQVICKLLLSLPHMPPSVFMVQQFFLLFDPCSI